MGHLMGTKHREMFMDTKVSSIGSMSRVALLRRVTPYSENNRRLSDLITTKISDFEYPWPPGKAPWAVGRGMSGVAPVINDVGSSSTEKKLVLKGGTKLPPPDSIVP